VNKLRNSIFVIVLVLVLIFVFQNYQVVEVKFLFWTLAISRALLLLGALLVGVVLGWFGKSSRQANKVKNLAKA